MLIEVKKDGLKINDKIFFSLEKKPFTVKAINERYAICTQEYNLKKTVFYTIIDFLERKRSTHDLIFNLYDFTEQPDIDKCLSDLKSGELGLSRRNSVDLDITKVRIYKQIEG